MSCCVSGLNDNVSALISVRASARHCGFCALAVTLQEYGIIGSGLKNGRCGVKHGP